jgi:hypothetical protein
MTPLAQWIRHNTKIVDVCRVENWQGRVAQMDRMERKNGLRILAIS